MAQIGHTCPQCGKRIYGGQLLVRVGSDWKVFQHAACAAKLVEKMRNLPSSPTRENGLRVAVTGGRAYSNSVFLAEVLGQLQIAVLAHGAAPGADTLAARWCRDHDCPVVVYEADWSAYGKRAGPLRNRRMLDHFQPDLLVAFSGGEGTQDCIRAAKERKVPVWRTWVQRKNPLLASISD